MTESHGWVKDDGDSWSEKHSKNPKTSVEVKMVILSINQIANETVEKKKEKKRTHLYKERL